MLSQCAEINRWLAPTTQFKELGHPSLQEVGWRERFQVACMVYKNTVSSYEALNA